MEKLWLSKIRFSLVKMVVLLCFRDAQDTCDFQSSLHSLAVSHGGADASTAWMDKVLQNTIEDVKSDSFMSEKVVKLYSSLE